MEKGFLALVLHAHLPFVRHPEYEEALEEHWLFEAITESYIPLLLVLEGLLADGIDFRLTLSISPTLAAMLGDPFLQGRYLQRLDRLIELGRKEIERTRPQPEFHALACMYTKHLQQVRAAFLTRYDRNLAEAFRRFQDCGKLEILATAATHGYLPLLSVNPTAVQAQIRIGVEEYRRLFGRRPKGFWLPECGFYPGVDRLLAEQSIEYTITETHGITRAAPRPQYGVYGPVSCPSGVAVFGRDPESSRQVWSSEDGYPGDSDYREFYRDIAYNLGLDYIGPYILRDSIRIDSGFKYFRITGKTDRKEVYIAERAADKARLHAADFMDKRRRQVRDLASVMDRKPLIVAPYDAELFGHWWFEGPAWLNFLVRMIAGQQETIRLITLSEYLIAYPANRVATPCSSSWGRNGFHETWLSERNDWIYRHLHQGAEIMATLASRYAGAHGLTQRALRQAARELLLAQSSDWAFMINSGTMPEYATQRTKTHLARLHRLRAEIEGGSIDEKRLEAAEKQYTIFPDLDLCSFI